MVSSVNRFLEKKKVKLPQVLEESGSRSGDSNVGFRLLDPDPTLRKPQIRIPKRYFDTWSTTLLLLPIVILIEGNSEIVACTRVDQWSRLFDLFKAFA